MTDKTNNRRIVRFLPSDSHKTSVFDNTFHTLGKEGPIVGHPQSIMFLMVKVSVFI